MKRSDLERIQTVDAEVKSRRNDLEWHSQIAANDAEDIPQFGEDIGVNSTPTNPTAIPLPPSSRRYTTIHPNTMTIHDSEFYNAGGGIPIIQLSMTMPTGTQKYFLIIDNLNVVLNYYGGSECRSRFFTRCRSKPEQGMKFEDWKPAEGIQERRGEVLRQQIREEARSRHIELAFRIYSVGTQGRKRWRSNRETGVGNRARSGHHIALHTLLERLRGATRTGLCRLDGIAARDRCSVDTASSSSTRSER
ncbi:hypothetical protein C8R42DRAFT_649169 [Lentinula raphanica]|nr:hypothetical protein C8R42DRAFT_649169 [Lentinula raphanica]